MLMLRVNSATRQFPDRDLGIAPQRLVLNEAEGTLAMTPWFYSPRLVK